ncbi:MAG: hypothetical protein SVV80_13375, partial [Planctomycetota bacterium]|nr:hypothetical protein [Planctomycetota bacterium]
MNAKIRCRDFFEKNYLPVGRWISRPGRSLWPGGQKGKNFFRFSYTYARANVNTNVNTGGDMAPPACRESRRKSGPNGAVLTSEYEKTGTGKKQRILNDEHGMSNFEVKTNKSLPLGYFSIRNSKFFVQYSTFS